MESTNCNCRQEVNTKIDNGELRNALNRNSMVTTRAEDSMVRQACDRKSLRGKFVDGGEVRNALRRAGWSQNHIDFLLYRSQHEHEND